jgi:hypothetical protein
VIVPPVMTWREIARWCALLALCHVSIALDVAIHWLSGPAPAPMRAPSQRAGGLVTPREGQGPDDEFPLEPLRDVR